MRNVRDIVTTRLAPNYYTPIKLLALEDELLRTK